MLGLLGRLTIIAILLVAPWPAQAQTGVLTARQLQDDFAIWNWKL